MILKIGNKFLIRCKQSSPIYLLITVSETGKHLIACVACGAFFKKKLILAITCRRVNEYIVSLSNSLRSVVRMHVVLLRTKLYASSKYLKCELTFGLETGHLYSEYCSFMDIKINLCAVMCRRWQNVL